MNQETILKLRVQIAELIGWKYEGHGNWIDPEGSNRQALYPTGEYEGKMVGTGKYDDEVPPDYPRVLDDMHDAEKTLEPVIQREKYPEILAQIVARDEGFRTNGIPLPDWHWVTATAGQRAEAFVLVMGAK